jgi:hypothetical protein
MKSLIITVLLLLVVVLVFTSASDSTVEVHHCIQHCLTKKKATTTHCEYSCKHKQSLGKLEVFFDGKPVVPKSSAQSLSDNVYSVNGVNFNRQFYNTPGSFSEILDFRGELLSTFYATAQSRFVSPGHNYPQGTKLHVLPVPIPLTEDQFNSQEFMDKLLDVVPLEESEYKPASHLTLSEAYKEYLLSIKVDAQHLEDGPRSPDVQNNIKAKEDHLENVLNNYMVLADQCYDAYQRHLSNNQLTQISYTIESYTPHNQQCRDADAKLQEHSRLSDELADYVANLNPYNQLFSSIGQLKNGKNWNYAKDEIQQFQNYHRNMEDQGIVPVSSQYQIPINIARNNFNHHYFGNTIQYSESNVNAHLIFSGMGWKETSISPKTTWFNLNTLNKYKNNPMTVNRNFLGFNGILYRIPTHMLIAYKPILKVKISRSMKDGFNNRATTHEIRPLEAGPFVFTRVDVTTVAGGSANEEFEMEFSSTVRAPQIIGFKSAPVVYVQPPPPPPPPAYLQFIGKQVAIRTAHGTYLRAHKGANAKVDVQRVAETHERWFIQNVGEGKVAIMSWHGSFLRAHPGGEYSKVDASPALGDWERFTLLQVDGKWAIKSIHGTYIRAHAGGEGSTVDTQTFPGPYEQFNIEIQGTPAYLPYLNRLVSIRTAHGTYVRAHPGGQGSKVDIQTFVGPWEKWRVVYAGEDKVAFMSPHPNQYLRSHGPKKVLWFRSSSQYCDIQTYIDACEKFDVIAVGNGQLAIRGNCHGEYLRAESGGEGARVNTQNSIGDWEKFTMQIVE